MMEHILWRSIESDHTPDVETVSAEITRLIMKAIAPENDELRRLQKFHDEVTASLKRIDD